MKMPDWRILASACAALALAAIPAAAAADYPAPKEGDWIAHDFRFHTGETMPELHIHYRTIGDPSGEPVLVLHGSAGSGLTLLNANFAGELFGPDQALDSRKYFIILPDALGSGKSTKPSDGLRMKFPKFDYTDMNNANYRLLTEGLGIHHLRVIIGQSMGGMETWLWAEQYPSFMDALVPMSSLPAAMAGRNWMMRRMLIDAIENDSGWNNGDYTSEPAGLKLVNAWFNIATTGGNQADYRIAPTRELADKAVAARLAAPFSGDANNLIYSYSASSDYDPAPDLGHISAALLAINSADDERNPVELGLMEPAIKQIANAHYYLIPASPETHGHGTVGYAKFWKQQFQDFLQAVPRRQGE